MKEKLPLNPSDKEIEEEIKRDQEEACNKQHSHDGCCPCCGVFIEYEHVRDSNGALQQICPSCGWESDLFYDW